MDDIGHIIFTNNDILKQITKWHILDYLNDEEHLINILCQDKNIDNLIWLLCDKYITVDILNNTTTKCLSKFNYFSYDPLFLDYAHFANSPKITSYFKYITNRNINLTEYMQNVFEKLEDNKMFISFYNYLPQNNLFDKFIHDYETHNLIFNKTINNNLFNDMNCLAFNHCFIAGDFGTQYDLKELHYNDNLLKFLLKSGLITLDFLDKKFIDFDKCITIRSSIVYMLYKNFSKTLEYILYKYPIERNQLIDGFSDKLTEFLFSQNIETIIVLLKNNISELHTYILEYIFKYISYKLTGPLGRNIYAVIDTFQKLNIYPHIIQLIKQNKINELKKVYEYVCDNTLKYTDETVNNIIMCYTEQFVEHFNTLNTEMKNDCVKYLLKHGLELMSKIINDDAIDISFEKKINILMENNMYDNAYDYITNFDYEQDKVIKKAMIYVTNPCNISDIVLDIKPLFDYLKTADKKEKIYESLNKFYISKHMIDFILDDKLSEWDKICKMIIRNPLKYIDDYVEGLIESNKSTFANIYEGFSEDQMKENIKNKLISNLSEPKNMDVLALSNFELDKKNYNNYDSNKKIHKLFCDYCTKTMGEMINNYIICYTPKFADHFKTLSIDKKNRCLNYLLENNEYNLISKIIFDPHIKLDNNVKLRILLESNMYDDLINYILLGKHNNNDEYINLEKKYNYKPPTYTILNGVYTQDNKEILLTKLEEKSLINLTLNESILQLNIHGLLTYIYNNGNKYDIIQFFKNLCPKLSIEDNILIIKNLPKSLDNFHNIFVLLCDILLEKIITCNKMLYCIKNTETKKTPERKQTMEEMMNFIPPRCNKREVDINEFTLCLETILSSENILKEQVIGNNPITIDVFPTINDTMLLIDSNINFVDLAYEMLLQNNDIINFVNEYNLGIHLNEFTNNTYSNYIIKNIIAQNLLNIGKYNNYEIIQYKFLHMTHNIYKKNRNNINNIINSVIIPDHNMLTIVYNYSKSLIKNVDIQLYELQIFLQSIQQQMNDDDIYNNFSFDKNNYEKLSNTNFLLEYFIKNNMPKCLNEYLNNNKVKYFDDHVKMANKSELLNILKKNKSSHIKEYMPLTLLVKIQ